MNTRSNFKPLLKGGVEMEQEEDMNEYLEHEYYSPRYDQDEIDELNAILKGGVNLLKPRTRTGRRHMEQAKLIVSMILLAIFGALCIVEGLNRLPDMEKVQLTQREIDSHIEAYK